MKARVWALLVLGAMAGTAAQRGWSQGSLTPAQKPAPMMKTLDQIEPRTPISSLPYTIDEPGSYYLTCDLTGVSGSKGITIAASDVTLDLNGFSLVGVPGSLEGIDVTSSRRSIAIRNGTVRNWDSHGVDALTADSSMLVGLRVYTNGWGSFVRSGMRVGDNSMVRDCVSEANQGDGIYAAAGSTVAGCSARTNGGHGILVFVCATVEGCAASANGEDGINTSSGCTVSRCAVYDNKENGINADIGNTVSACTAYRNVGNGIRAIVGTTVSRCTARLNRSDGIYASSGVTVSECTCGANDGDGIQAAYDCRVANNTCSTNGYLGSDGAGIHVTGNRSRIDGNTVTDNDRGIDVDNADNLVVRNSASSNVRDYDIVADNDVGMIRISPVGAEAWDNFQF